MDDDTWVNIDVFPRFIETMKPERSYLGLMMEGMEILKGRHKNAENKLPASMKTFPPYASGCATIVTHDLAMLLGTWCWHFRCRGPSVPLVLSLPRLYSLYRLRT